VPLQQSPSVKQFSPSTRQQEDWTPDGSPGPAQGTSVGAPASTSGMHALPEQQA
jgi:hypothetical protein